MSRGNRHCANRRLRPARLSSGCQSSLIMQRPLCIRELVASDDERDMPLLTKHQITVLGMAILFSGCVQPPMSQPTVGALDSRTTGPLLAFDATGLRPLDTDFAGVRFRLAETGMNGPEPTMGVLSDGTLFVAVRNNPTNDPFGGAAGVARSEDQARSWEYIATGDPATRPKLNADPWIWVDPWTDRVYNVALYMVCSWTTWSDDGGDSWDGFNPATGCMQGLPGQDHQKLTSGPPARGATTSGFPNVLYYTYNSQRPPYGTWIQVSLDGGETYTLGQRVHPHDDCTSGIAGPVAIGEDGVAYSPKPICDGIAIAVTGDNGQTWSHATVKDAGAVPAYVAMTDAAVDKALNAYAIWTGADGRPYVTVSTDQGRSWSRSIRASPPDITASTHNVIVAGETGRVAVAYLGTRADVSKWPATSAQDADEGTVWHLFISMTDDALAEDPVWTSIQVTPDDDPVQIGPIALDPAETETRNLQEFIDMVVSKEGRIHVAYADGCDRCSKASESRRGDATVAILDVGPSLLGGRLEPELRGA